MSFASEGMTAWPEKPAMNNPKAIPSSLKFLTSSEVSAGLQRLPGASRFVKPSIKTTAIINTVETMPNTDAYDRRDKGRNTVGTNLEWRLALEEDAGKSSHMRRPHSL
jgi:hypothetical protein